MEPTTPEPTKDEFHAHAAAAMALLDEASIPNDVNFTLEQQVSDGEDLVSHYHLRINNGLVAVVDGAAAAPDITLRQDVATARSLQDGSLHAQGAFLTGRLSIDGDINKLLEHGALLTELLNTTAKGS